MSKSFILSIISQKETYRVTTGLRDCNSLNLQNEVYKRITNFIKSGDEVLYLTIKPAKIKNDIPTIY